MTAAQGKPPFTIVNLKQIEDSAAGRPEGGDGVATQAAWGD